MALTVPNIGKTTLLDYLLTFGNLWYSLYKNDPTIDRTVTVATFTIATYTGYAAQGAAGWAASTIDGSNRATSNATQLTYVFTGGTAEDIYGYFVSNSANPTGGNPVLWAERFSMAPIHLAVAGDAILLTPNLTLKSEFNN